MQRLRARAGQRLTRNLGWFGLAEILVRITRLAATVVVARLLVPEHFGVAAAALTAYELVRILATNGSGLMIVRAEAGLLERTCTTVWRISGVVAGVMIALLNAVSLVLWATMGRGDVCAMAAVLSLAFVVLPMTDVRYCRILRSNQMKTLAGIGAAQVLTENALAVALALGGFGAWALVLPKVATVPLYARLLRRAEPWRPDRSLPTLPLATVAHFSLPLMASDGLATLRNHVDKVLVGALLGVEALGIYAFALNAGLGLTLSLTGALATTLYPHLAELAHDRRAMLARFDDAMRSSVPIVAGLVALQAAAAIVYVPIVFGSGWSFAAPLVATLCAAGVTRPLFDASCQLLRARGETRLELAGGIGFTLALLGVFAIALPHGLATAAIAFAVTSIVGHIVFAALVRAHVGRGAHDALGVPSA